MANLEKLRNELRLFGTSDYAVLTIAEMLKQAATSPNGRLETKSCSRVWMGYVMGETYGLMKDYQMTEEGRKAYERFQKAGVYSSFDNKMRMAHQDAVVSAEERIIVIEDNDTVEK